MTVVYLLLPLAPAIMQDGKHIGRLDGARFERLVWEHYCWKHY